MRKSIHLTKSNWGPAFLFRMDGRKCCLGHECVRRGVRLRRSKSIGMPEDLLERVVDKVKVKMLGWLVKGKGGLTTKDAQIAADANDDYFDKQKWRDEAMEKAKKEKDSYFVEVYRESANSYKQEMAKAKETIIRIFAKHGVKVTFGRGL